MYQITNEDIISAAKGEIVGNVYPYTSNDLNIIKLDLIYLMNRISDRFGLLKYDEFDNFGSGYASFICSTIYSQDKLFQKDVYTINNSEIRERFPRTFRGTTDAPELKLKSAEMVEVMYSGPLLMLSQHLPVAAIGSNTVKYTLFNGRGVSSGGGMHNYKQESNIFSQFKREIDYIREYLLECNIQVLEPDFLREKINVGFDMHNKNVFLRKGETPSKFDAIFYWMD